MSQQTDPVNVTGYNNIASLANVGLCMELMELAINSPNYLDSIVGFYGYSGYGKSTGAAYVANRYRAYYVECLSCWTRKDLIKNICIEIGLDSGGTISDMVARVSAELAITNRPLIIDEFDYVVKKRMVDLVRDIYMGSGRTPILIIGEEQVEANLRKQWERFHNRMVGWEAAQPVDMTDAKQLRQLYCREVHIDDDLLLQIVKVTKGVTRRVCINLERAQEFALSNGIDTLTLAEWGNGADIYTGETVRRKH
ncbi:MAG: ATP-binding protein [Chromatiales bacterium]|nr:ATP-binding protein [Chromatiales bacterium]